jgi:hypothetical protein
MTNTDKARYVAERLGLCWHTLVMCSPYLVPCSLCSCGIVFSDIDKHFALMNPTFLDPAGRIQLLELMMGDYHDEFLVENGGLSKYGRHLDTVIVDLLIEPGLLLDASYRFLKEKEK